MTFFNVIVIYFRIDFVKNGAFVGFVKNGNILYNEACHFKGHHSLLINTLSMLMMTGNLLSVKYAFETDQIEIRLTYLETFKKIYVA